MSVFEKNFIELGKVHGLTQEASDAFANLLKETAEAAKFEMGKILQEHVNDPQKMIELAVNSHFLSK